MSNAEKSTAPTELTQEELIIAERFETHLQEVKPALFNLADQLITAYPEKQWNLIIGDDTGARLPVRFLRKTLETEGIDIPVRYIRAGGNARNHTDPTVFEHCADIIAAEFPNSKALIITETIATGETLHYLKELFARRFAQVDLATVAKRYPETEFDHSLFSGAVGQEWADAVNSTFERVSIGDAKRATYEFLRKLTPSFIRKYLRKPGAALLGAPTAHHLHNLDNRPQANEPIAHLYQDPTYRTLSNYCYKRMDALASEYRSSRSHIMRELTEQSRLIS